MDFATIALAASLGLGQVYVGGKCVGEDCLLATCRDYPANMVDGTDRPGFNGRLYLRRPVIGGLQGYHASGCDAPATYGAYGFEHELVWARVGHQPIALDPFTQLPRTMVRLERARATWLRQNGYTGGVRTFVNDAYLYQNVDEDGEAHASATPTPRATIKVPESWRRTPTLRVQADDLRPVVSMTELAQRDEEIEHDARPVVRADSTDDEAADETLTDAG
jgi:hypothetical protein